MQSCTAPHISELRSWVLVSARLQDLIRTLKTFYARPRAGKTLHGRSCLCFIDAIRHGSSLFTVQRSISRLLIASCMKFLFFFV